MVRGLDSFREWLIPLKAKAWLDLTERKAKNKTSRIYGRFCNLAFDVYKNQKYFTVPVDFVVIL